MTMKKKYLNTLIALALLGVVWGGMTLWEKRKGQATPKSEATSQEKLLALDSNHITAFTLRPRDGQPLACRRDGKGWKIVEPEQLPADSSGVSSLLSTLTTTTVDQVVDPHPKRLKDFGLDKPSETLDVETDTKPAKLTLLLGDESPTGGGVYAQVEGSPRVVLLGSYVKSSLAKNLVDLRDKRAVTLDVDRLQKIEVETKEKHWKLEKNPEGAWDLVLPPAVRVDRFTVDGLLDRLRSASMQTVVEEDKEKARKDFSKYGLVKPTLRLQLTAAGSSQSLVLGDKDKESDRNYATNSALAPVFTLGSDFLTEFQKDPADLRDKNLFSFSTFEIKQIEVESPKGHRVFEQEKDKWKQTAPNAKDVSKDKIEAFLGSLRDLRADSFPKGTNLATLGLKRPTYKFQVVSGEKRETQTVEVAKVGDHVYAMRSTDLLACELSKSALNDLEKALNEL